MAAAGAALAAVGPHAHADTGAQGSDPSKRFYVATTGADTNDGSVQHPFATLERARDAIRALVAGSGLPKGGVAVVIRAGRYERTSSFVLTAQDSGTPDAPIVYRTQGNETVEIVGGKRLDTSAFAAVSDPSIAARLAPGVRSKVRQISLPGQGITSYGELQSFHFGQVVPAATQLIFDNVTLDLARWPNSGYTETGSVINQGNTGQPYAFHYTDPRPSTWASVDDVWMMAYPRYNWAFQTLPITTLDTATTTITSAAVTQYGAVAGARYFYFNVLEELDSPGEWYLDRSTGVLYVYPPDDLATARVRLTQLADPLVSLTDTHDVRFVGLTFGEVRGDAVVGTGVSRVVVDTSALSFIGNHAVVLSGGVANGVTGCAMHDIGTGAVVITAGDRPSLTPGQSFVEDSTFARFSLVNPTYSPAITCSGVENRVAHNEISDAPHEAITFSGNDHVFEYNHIHHVVQDSADAGAIYAGRDWTWRGNVVRYNYLHDISNETSGGNRVGVYLDDMLSGTFVYGNVFERVDTPVQHSGRDNVVDNNLMISCRLPVYIGNWGAGNLPTLKQRLAAMPYQQEPWASRYPELLTILDDAPGVPKYNTVIRTVMADGGAPRYVTDAVTYGWIMDDWPGAPADLGLVGVDGGPDYLTARSPIVANVPDFASIPTALTGPGVVSVLLTRTKHLVTAFTGSGDLSSGAAAPVAAGLTQAGAALDEGDESGAVAALQRVAARVVASAAQSDQCSPQAAAGLAALLDAMIGRLSPDTFTDVSVHAVKSVVAVGDTVRLWMMGDMLSGRYVNVLPRHAVTSLTPAVARFDTPDVATALAVGTAVLQGSATYDGRSRSAQLRLPVVTALLATITASAPTQLLDLGATTPLTVAGVDTTGAAYSLAGATLQYVSSDPTVATVDGSGVVKGVKQGIATLSVRAIVDGVSADTAVGIMVSPASATLPDPWRVTNYGHTVHGGTVATQGAATFAAGQFRAMTDGANVWNDSDDCTFVHQAVAAGTTASVSTTLRSGTGSRAGYGVMIRADDTAGANEVHFRRQDDGQLNLVYRNAAKPSSWYAGVGDADLPVQLKLARQGDVFTGYVMSNGAWTPVGSVSAEMGTAVEVGVAIYASTAVVAEVTYDAPVVATT